MCADGRVPQRSRPVVMTSLAMGAGMLPLAMRLEQRGDSTSNGPNGHHCDRWPDHVHLLSLLVVPAAFTYVDDLEHWLLCWQDEQIRTTPLTHAQSRRPAQASQG